MTPAQPGPRNVCKQAASAIDVAFLDRYTLGDPALRFDILQSFADHTPTIIARARTAHSSAAAPAPAPDAWQREMHGLKGSARAIGAFTLGERAETAEQMPSPRCAVTTEQALAPILAAFEAVLRDIERLRPMA